MYLVNRKIVIFKICFKFLNMYWGYVDMCWVLLNIGIIYCILFIIVLYVIFVSEIILEKVCIYLDNYSENFYMV